MSSLPSISPLTGQNGSRRPDPREEKNMDNLPRELGRLERMIIPELRRRYLEVLGAEELGSRRGKPAFGDTRAS
jgi:hypothetical protein